jgi:CRP-like cAMP-binding protein
MSDQLYLLRKLPMFIGLSDREIEKVFSSMEDTVIPAGKLLFEEGSKSNALYVVWTGAIEISQQREGGLTKLAVLEMGDCLGEMGLLRDTARSASARAAKESILMALKKEKLDALATTDPKIWGRIMANLAIQLADRLEQLERRLGAMASSQAAGGAAPKDSSSDKGVMARLFGW